MQNNFISDKDYERYISFGLEYLEKYMTQTIFLYKVDRIKSDTDNIYHDPLKSEINLQEPIEINCLVDLGITTNKSYDDKNIIRIEEYGNLTLTVLNRILSKLKTEIDYGDYILYVIQNDLGEYKRIFFQVANDDKKYYNNNKTWGAFKAYYRVFVCTPVDENHLKFL